MKKWRIVKPILLLLFVAICVTTRCDCSDEENMEVPSEVNIDGTWILKSAELRDGAFDFDGDGSMLPIKDIKDFLLNLFDVNATCSTIDEMPIQFSTELAHEATSADATNKFKVFAVCPAGQGITSQFAEYYFDPFRADAFYLDKEALNDPANLIKWTVPMHIFIIDDFKSEGKRVIHGKGSIVPNIGSAYQHFNFVLEEYLELD